MVFALFEEVRLCGRTRAIDALEEVALCGRAREIDALGEVVYVDGQER